VTNSTFFGNASNIGGGASTTTQTPVIVTNSTFSDNLGFFLGGGSISTTQER